MSSATIVESFTVATISMSSKIFLRLTVTFLASNTPFPLGKLLKSPFRLTVPVVSTLTVASDKSPAPSFLTPTPFPAIRNSPMTLAADVKVSDFTLFTLIAGVYALPSLFNMSVALTISIFSPIYAFELGVLIVTVALPFSVFLPVITDLRAGFVLMICTPSAAVLVSNVILPRMSQPFKSMVTIRSIFKVPRSNLVPAAFLSSCTLRYLLLFSASLNALI